MLRQIFAIGLGAALIFSLPAPAAGAPQSFSGIYPHLAAFNDEGECGTGAVVPWADRLWVITYGPHKPFGSSDKLYEITPDLRQIIRPESTGGTHANRMIHRETGQLIIGPYLIDQDRRIRAIPWQQMPGRLTATARHLADPQNKIYFITMEEGLYEVDLKTLDVTTLIADANKPPAGQPNMPRPAAITSRLPGYHGKGAYSGQGRIVYAQNGEQNPRAATDPAIPSGALAEWAAPGDWKLIRRNQFTEVTGPGGLYGNPRPATDPLWSLGWDHRSLILMLLDHGSWHPFRLPKASHTYDGSHGWNTEWPRIRDVGPEGQPQLLMTMHGMFWHFPPAFSAANTAGIRPRGAYLKVIGDFARFQDRLVFGCDDSALSAFYNTRRIKGPLPGPGQSQSNLWFTSPDQPDSLGPTSADGAVWLRDPVKEGDTSEPMLFAGWPHRIAFFANEADHPVPCTLEIDPDGRGRWTRLRDLTIPPKSTALCPFDPADQGQWIRIRAGASSPALSAHFVYASPPSTPSPSSSLPAASLFNGLAKISEPRPLRGLLRATGGNARTLALAAPDGYYELDAAMKLTLKPDESARQTLEKQLAIPQNALTVDAASVLIIDDRARRWRLPMGDPAFDTPTRNGQLRLCREVATERDLFNCHGTFYELPAENADGFAKIRPIASHSLAIHDYASYRGLLILTGISPETPADNPHIIRSPDARAALWAGAIDDLWQLGKPTGRGGPWKNTPIQSDTPSDPYLFGFYDRKTLTLSHTASTPITFRVELDPGGAGQWFLYQTFTVTPGQSLTHTFPPNISARWIRFTADQAATATAWLEYR